MGGGVMAPQLAVTKKDVIRARNWRPNASVPDSSFAFTPSASAKKVAFAPPRKG
jgi:hypothetical protein